MRAFVSERPPVRRAFIPALAAGVALIWAGPGRALPDRAAVEQTLAEMARAVRAGDGAGYLAHVSRADPLFLREQQMWARDLAAHRPAAFELSIGDAGAGEAPGERAAEFGDEVARFELVMTWAMKRADDGTPTGERTISFPCRFVTDEAGARWLFAGEDWLVLEGEGPTDEGAEAATRPATRTASGVVDGPERGLHAERRARVKYFAGYERAAERAAGVLPGVRRHVHAELGVEVARVQEVKLYPSVRHLQASIYLSYAEPLGGWNEPGESIKLVVRPNASETQLRPLLAHEYGHVGSFELGPRANDMPWWTLEGVAELTAERYATGGGGGGHDAAASVAAWHRAGTLQPWDQLADFKAVPPKLHRFVYKQGHHMLGYVTEAHGRAKRNAWLRAMASGRTLDEATREALGLGFADLDGAWRARVRALAEEPAGKDTETKP